MSPDDGLRGQVGTLVDRVTELEAEVAALRTAADGTGPRFAAVYARFAAIVGQPVD